jgi:hypothetical protein
MLRNLILEKKKNILIWVERWLFVLFVLVGIVDIYYRGRDRMVVVFATTCAISVYHH